MTPGEILDLLSIVQSYDGRTVGETDVHAWGDAAHRHKWSYERAADAVKAHYGEHTEWIMPGHITSRIKHHRSTPKSLPRAEPSSAHRDHIDKVVAWLSDRTRADRQHRNDENRACLSITCPYCGAPESKPCVQTADGLPTQPTKPITMPHLHRRTTQREMNL